MDNQASSRKRWPPEDDKRGPERRHCGCKHFRSIATRPGQKGHIIRRLECGHCGKRVTGFGETEGSRSGDQTG